LVIAKAAINKLEPDRRRTASTLAAPGGSTNASVAPAWARK